MVNFLKDISINAFIADIPSVIGYNNRAIDREFAMLFDTSNNRLIKGLYAPNDSVEAHWGKFVNLKCDFIDVANPSSFVKVLNKVPHNALDGRFMSDNIDENGNVEFCHDLGSIASGFDDGESLAGRLAKMDTSMRRIYRHLSIKDSDVFPHITDTEWVDIERQNVSAWEESSYQGSIIFNDRNTGQLAYWTPGEDRFSEGTVGAEFEYIPGASGGGSNIDPDAPVNGSGSGTGCSCPGLNWGTVDSSGRILSDKTSLTVFSFDNDWIKADKITDIYTQDGVRDMSPILGGSDSEIDNYLFEYSSSNIIEVTEDGEKKNYPMLRNTEFLRRAILRNTSFVSVILHNNVVKILDTRLFVFSALAVGQIVRVLFTQSVMSQQNFYINRNSKRNLVIYPLSDPELMDLSLICTGIEADGQCTWKIYSTNIPASNIGYENFETTHKG